MFKNFPEGTTPPSQVPAVVFHTRIRDESIEGPNPYRWQDVTSSDYFSGKRVVVFSLPGAFTPTCSTYQLPGYEEAYDELKSLGIDEVYCVSVNDSFVMNKWAQAQEIKNVKVIPDGNGEFTDGMGMLVNRNELGFGNRSWRYSAVINNGQVEAMFVEPGIQTPSDVGDPYEVTDPQTMLSYLRG